MKTQRITITFFLLLFSSQAHSQHSIQINIPSAKTEARYIWQTLKDIPFFEEHGYDLSLPKGPLIEELKQKSRSGNLGQEDYPRLEQFVLDSVYNQADYQVGYGKIYLQMELIDKMLRQLQMTTYDWNFRTFDVYMVNLTLYGPGGSYDPEMGSILIFTTPDGRFKNYDNPANTIIHEAVHIGIEASIVTRYEVPHALKERIVDSFVLLRFGPWLPDYRMQNMGDTRTDPYLKTADDLKDLDTIMQEVLR